MQSLKSIALNILNESPDGVGRNRYESPDAFTFGYDQREDTPKYENFKMTSKSTHWDLFHKERESIKYSGRLWKNEGIIALWSYPKTLEILKMIVRDINLYSLEHKFGFLVKSSWKIEEIFDRVEGTIKAYIPYPNDMYYKYSPYKYILVPINDYMKPLKPEWDEIKYRNHNKPKKAA